MLAIFLAIFWRILTSGELTAASAGETRLVAALEGKPVELKCSSSFAPPWTWTSTKDGLMKTLAISGTKPHPKLNEPRFEFSREENDYFLRISRVEIADAGKFVCDGDSYDVSVLTVMR